MLLIVGLLLWLLMPAHCASTLEFFRDKNCNHSLGKLNGTTDGLCKQAVANNGGIRVVALDGQCAATIYSDPYCSNDATIADLNTCMSGALVVGSFSIDCPTSNPSSVAFTQASKRTSTSYAFDTSAPTSTSRSSTTSIRTAVSTGTHASSGAGSTQAASSDTASADQRDSDDDSSSVAPGTIAGIVVGCFVLVALLPIGYFLRRHLKIKTQTQSFHGAPGAGSNEIYGNETAELPPTYPRPPPHPGAVAANSHVKTAYSRHAEADSTPYSLDTTAPPEYYAREKALPPEPVTVQKPGIYAELADDNYSPSGQVMTSRLDSDSRSGHTSSSFVSPLTGHPSNGPVMGSPF